MRENPFQRPELRIDHLGYQLTETGKRDITLDRLCLTRRKTEYRIRHVSMLVTAFSQLPSSQGIATMSACSGRSG